MKPVKGLFAELLVQNTTVQAKNKAPKRGESGLVN